MPVDWNHPINAISAGCLPCVIPPKEQLSLLVSLPAPPGGSEKYRIVLSTEFCLLDSARAALPPAAVEGGLCAYAQQFHLVIPIPQVR